MASYIFGKIEINDDLLKKDLEVHDTFPKIPEEYDEFSAGFWMNCTLWSASEDETDTQYRDYDHEIKQTGYGKKLYYISNLLQENFNMENLKMVRTRNLIDALIMPHRDFVDLDKNINQYFRVFIPLEDNEMAYHSDENNVFRMRKGEVWFLDAGIVHAAANFSNNNRLFLCLDFAFDSNYHASDIFKDKNLYNTDIEPFIVEREDIDQEYEERIISSLTNVISRYNFKEIVFLLSKIHFYKNIPIDVCYKWLAEIAKRANDEVMVDKANKVHQYLIEKRELGERFSFSDWSSLKVTVGN
ncbi:aspartyl/asparaginyl beta-hydroxylase domain-containing protein [Cytobacillus sp. NCCP-133]|uniref:aspartyl/asparaginyl beta-hydroxylase domain-containing protein n=1 Tax=Cytobacillus sp. NCCP-133 TaxID=766848 RepID=UPI002230F02D|nr:aspartyl/asparaginyl beta-hydroxylase domain-containing protein [Cytobacillus sp. NCCP-133]GLB61004.1 L-proline cis-4-hydroxylase [Cytobacillus sp. NCCP-133]